jgi:hypothetical protein
VVELAKDSDLAEDSNFADESNFAKCGDFSEEQCDISMKEDFAIWQLQDCAAVASLAKECKVAKEATLPQKRTSKQT